VINKLLQMNNNTGMLHMSALQHTAYLLELCELINIIRNNTCDKVCPVVLLADRRQLMTRPVL
jgi:hypothetical protein